MIYGVSVSKNSRAAELLASILGEAAAGDRSI